jgi:GT2 family glycosyltransferase
MPIHRRLTLEDLGVAVLAYGCSDAHARVLQDLAASGFPGSRIIVVHNPDRPPNGWAPALPPDGTLIELPRNRGYATAMNEAISEFTSRGMSAVLLLTHDARLDPSTLDTLVMTARDAPQYGVLGLAVRGAGNATTSYGAYIGADGLARHLTIPPGTDDVVDTEFVDGSVMLLRLEACGPRPLPERYFMYFEEAEVCAAVRDRGWRVGTALNATAESVSGTRQRRAAFQYLYVRNGLDWMLRHRGRAAALRFAVAELRRALRDTPKPGGRRFRDETQRRAGYKQLAARTLGVVDFARRRWGPPPSTLLASSDVRYT